MTRTAKRSDTLSLYMTEPYLHRRWDAVGRKLAFHAASRSAWLQWRRRTLKKLKELTGYNTMLRAPLKPAVLKTEKMDGYIRQHVHIQTEPGVYMTMYVLIPGHSRPPFIPVIAAHGHASGGKYSVAGRADLPEIAKAIETYNYAYGVSFVRAGFIVFCPDARGFGERQERRCKDAGSLTASSCLHLSNMAIPLGQTVAGMWAWDLHRLIDYIETRPDCRPGAVGCAGLSGGGLQTLWASALDTRIGAAIVSGYFYGYQEALLAEHQNCSCNYVPHLYEYVDMGDIGALIAPRALLVETGARDPLNGKSGMKNVRSQVDITRKAYRLLGAGARLEHFVFNGEHRWHGARALPWMKQWLA